MTQDNGEEYVGENPNIEKAADDFLVEFAKRTGDRNLVSKMKRSQRRSIDKRIFGMFIVPSLHHWRNGFMALRSILTELDRMERDPIEIRRQQREKEIEDLWFPLRSPFIGLENPRIASKMTYAKSELFRIEQMWVNIPEKPKFRGIQPMLRWFATPISDPETLETTYKPTIWLMGALDEIEWYMYTLDLGIEAMEEYLDTLPELYFPG